MGRLGQSGQVNTVGTPWGRRSRGREKGLASAPRADPALPRGVLTAPMATCPGER